MPIRIGVAGVLHLITKPKTSASRIATRKRAGTVETAKQQIEEWRTEAVDTTVMSASAVQDRLFDLWGELRELPLVTQVEQWLSLTVERELFSGKELVEFLNELEQGLCEAGAGAAASSGSGAATE